MEAISSREGYFVVRGVMEVMVGQNFTVSVIQRAL